jgi:predicted transcriptional regulator of viral defense system
MQPLALLRNALETLADGEHDLFQTSDFFALFPTLSLSALRMVLGRAVKSSLLQRVCSGIYCYPKARHRRDLLLYHVAAKLRSHQFCYLSLESVLSEAGVISQLPLGWITVMTSGRSGKIRCGDAGCIEFIHTRKKPETVARQLTYDVERKLWRASVSLARQDMKDAKRPMDLAESEGSHDAV